MKQNTAQQILDLAQSMVRNRGYSAFSYADIAKEIVIRQASIHYHFPSQEDLVKELVIRYCDRLVRKYQAVEIRSATLQEQLQNFVNIYRDGLADDRICWCGMLTADFVVLNSEIQGEKKFFKTAEHWLARILTRGSEAKVWQCTENIESDAESIIAML